MQILFSHQYTSAQTPEVPLYRAAKRRQLTQIYRGAYLQTGQRALDQVPTKSLHAAKAIAVGVSTSAAVLSGFSAAVMHDLPLLDQRIPQRVHLTRSSKSSANKWVVPHQSTLSDDDIVIIAGVRCTSITRTIRDLAGTLELHELLALADAARVRGVDLTNLPLALRNRQRLQWLADHASDRSESYAESWSRFLFISEGVDLPILQPTVISTSDGKFLARPDFATPDGLLGEFDGKIKYGDLVQPGESAADVVMREKRRENTLRDANFEIVRWDWNQLRNPKGFIKTWNNALDRARQLPEPRGRYEMRPVKSRPATDWRKLFSWDAPRSRAAEADALDSADTADTLETEDTIDAADAIARRN